MTIDQSEFRALVELSRCAGYLLRAGADAREPFTMLRRGDQVTVCTFADLDAVRDWLTD